MVAKAHWLKALLRRVGGMLLVVWAATTIAFFALRLVPGDPVDIMLGVHAQVSESVREQLRADLGLDANLGEQYLRYLARLTVGDFGTSYQLRKPVLTVIGEQLPATVQLTSAAMLLALVIAILITVLVRGQWFSALVCTLELVVVSSPTFWTGILLMFLFGFTLGWFPVLDSGHPAALVLPALTLALPVAAILSQVLRGRMRDALAEPFVLTVRARGATELRLHSHHLLRHGAVAGVALGGTLLGSLLGGAVLVETVFARPGLGRVALRAIIDRDVPVILGLVALSAAVFVVVNLVVDLVVGALDPRTRTASGQRAGIAS